MRLAAQVHKQGRAVPEHGKGVRLTYAQGLSVFRGHHTYFAPVLFSLSIPRCPREYGRECRSAPNFVRRNAARRYQVPAIPAATPPRRILPGPWPPARRKTRDRKPACRLPRSASPCRRNPSHTPWHQRAQECPPPNGPSSIVPHILKWVPPISKRPGLPRRALASPPSSAG